MREIKFRVWDKNYKIMHCEAAVRSIFSVSELTNCDDFVALQYTGLKDKNGVEIYEGDIVEAFSHGVKGTFEVKWRQEGSPSWILFPAWQSSQMWYLHAVETEKGYYKDNVTVVGNIYENPELLKEEPTC